MNLELIGTARWDGEWRQGTHCLSPAGAGITDVSTHPAFTGALEMDSMLVW